MARRRGHEVSVRAREVVPREELVERGGRLLARPGAPLRRRAAVREERAHAITQRPERRRRRRGRGRVGGGRRALAREVLHVDAVRLVVHVDVDHVGGVHDDAQPVGEAEQQVLGVVAAERVAPPRRRDAAGRRAARTEAVRRAVVVLDVRRQLAALARLAGSSRLPWKTTIRPTAPSFGHALASHVVSTMKFETTAHRGGAPRASRTTSRSASARRACAGPSPHASVRHSRHGVKRGHDNAPHAERDCRVSRAAVTRSPSRRRARAPSSAGGTVGTSTPPRKWSSSGCGARDGHRPIRASRWRFEIFISDFLLAVKAAAPMEILARQLELRGRLHRDGLNAGVLRHELPCFRAQKRLRFYFLCTPALHGSPRPTWAASSTSHRERQSIDPHSEQATRDAALSEEPLYVLLGHPADADSARAARFSSERRCITARSGRSCSPRRCEAARSRTAARFRASSSARRGNAGAGSGLGAGRAGCDSARGRRQRHPAPEGGAAALELERLGEPIQVRPDVPISWIPFLYVA